MIGIRAVLVRSMRIARALGLKGLLTRIRALRQIPPSSSPDEMTFPTASSLDQVHMEVGVMVHAYYTDILDELAADLLHMPLPYVLMVSVVDADAAAAVSTQFKNLPNVRELHVRVVPNRGRDIAPFLLDFRDEILALDLVCHVHTKKSHYTGCDQSDWRRYLLNSLLGSRDRVAWMLGMFQATPALGMIYPETFAKTPWWAHTWLSNLDSARELGGRLGLYIDPLAYIDYPVGSMFWARTDALRPLFDLGLSRNDFPPELGQTDGTLQHAIERLFGQVVRQQNRILGILPASGVDALRSEGERNWTAYFSATPSQRIAFAAIEAECISFDLFDTLVTRPFLHPSGTRAYLAHRVEQVFGLSNFAALREISEARARAECGCDVSSASIYAAMAHLPELHGQDVAAIRDLELATEARLLKPRRAVLDAARVQARAGKRIIAISDMYLTASELRHALPAPVTTALQEIYVSCDTGWRKDSGDVWRQLPERASAVPARWLHVGDNEHADVQLPLSLGFIGPVHTMRPAALLDVVPALRPLRPKPDLLHRWPDQLWLGLLANHFGALADQSPEAFTPGLVIETPETFGYVVLGPLLLDYCAWLARMTLESGNTRLLFLSREGYLLLRAFRRLQQSDPSLAAIRASYLLVSRRAVNTPSLHRIEDLAPIFAAPYTGSFHTMLSARLGETLADAVTRELGSAATAETVYLPEMGSALIERLRPAAAAILEIARNEREAYLAYWAAQTEGDAAIVADIGYAATIQTRLAEVTGASLHGAYFAVRRSALQAGRNRVSGRFHDGCRGVDCKPSPVMSHHLLLEAVLTAPEGQFSHFQLDANGPSPVHSSNAPLPATWAVIDRVQAGALQFMDDFCDVAGAEASQVTLDCSHVQRPLQCVGTGRWQLGDWARALAVEDQYTGRGKVSKEDIMANL
ncbi:rhamnan synthesis F family protein [Dyella sp.]|uniref:rhamnan synthesis F family protein n=1 Tax=Dyella sp. TaxID=1869338 RepID=UPI003F7F4A3F